MNRTILVVDDDPLFARRIIDVLEESGEPYTMLQALSGPRALEIAARARPDIVITDWDMPGLSGIETIRRLREIPECREVPVIMATGVMTSSEHLRTALDAGAVDYVRKPIDPVEVVARVRAVLLLASSHREVRRQRDELADKTSRLEAALASVQRLSQELADRNRELSTALDAVEKLSRRDPLTQLSNRRDALEHVGRELERARRSRLPIGVALIDVDHFKRINDTCGHDGGDAVLVQVAALLRERVRTQDLAARWGGEEFLLVLPETPRSGAALVAEAVRQAISQHTIAFADVAIRCTITAGVSDVPPGASFDAALKEADLALYRGKQAGRNRVEVAPET